MFRPILILLILLTLRPVASLTQERESTEKFTTLMESCQFSQIISLAESYLVKDSTRIDIMLLKGRAQASLYQYRESILTLRKALHSDTANIRILNELVEVYKQSGDQDKAIETCLKITILEPGNRYFKLHLANLYYTAEEFWKAVKFLLPLYREDSSAFFVARLLGNCFNEMKQSDSAIYFYRRALKINPFDPYVTGKLVNVFIRENETAIALYHAQVFLKHDSLWVPILKQRGYCNYLLIDFRSSAEQFLRCTRLGDSSKFTLKYLGLSYYKQDKYDTAVAFFRKAFYSDTTDAEVCFYYGVSAYRSLAVDTGLVYLNRTLRLLLPSGQFLSALYSELADANTSSGNPDTAIILLQKALETNPANNTLRFKIAYQFDYHLRKPYEGLPYYREFLKYVTPDGKTTTNLPQQVSYSDYAKNRIREISGTMKK